MDVLELEDKDGKMFKVNLKPMLGRQQNQVFEMMLNLGQEGTADKEREIDIESER